MIRRRGGLALAVWVGLSLGARPAGAFTITSGFTESCHERLGLAAMAVLLESLPMGGVAVPSDDLWRGVAAELAPAVLESAGLAAAAALTDPQKFVLFSVVVGIRAPDTGGHSVSNLDDLRRAQIDPSPDSQHLHCLRAPVEDGFAGDVEVLRGSEALIRAALSEAAAAADVGRRGNTLAPLYLDFYGQLDVEVDTPAYLIGRAMHTLQDCYAHTLRSADGLTVFSVLNYVEAVEGHLDEARDGMAHSDTLDDCRRSELEPLVARAAAVSSALAVAAVALATNGDATPLDEGFGPCAPGETQTATCAWLQYKADCAPAAQGQDVAACCSTSNAYCGSPFLGVAREDLTQPYVEEVLSCAATGRSGGRTWLSWPALGALAAAFLCLCSRGRRRPQRRRRSSGAVIILALGVQATPVAAQEAATYESDAFFVALEGHFSLLSDAPERSFLDVTTGFGVRGGYRFGRWGLLGQVERNYWLPTELSRDLVAGALNIGVGAEWFAVNGRVRLSATAGPSILWFDTALDDKGSVGVFADLRPAGLRWRPGRHLSVAFDPLSLALVAPVLGSPGIVQLEYRTLLGFEFLP